MPKELNPGPKFSREEGIKPDKVSPVGEMVRDFMDQMIENEQPLGGAQSEENIRKGKV